MTDLEGRCLCGAVTLTLKSVRPEISVCHCEMCRRWSGAPAFGVSGETLEVAGEAAVSVYRSSDWAERAFCSKCGANLWYRYLPGDHYSLLAGLFAGADDFQMTEQMFVDEKPAYYTFADDAPALTGAEAKAKYGVGED